MKTMRANVVDIQARARAAKLDSIELELVGSEQEQRRARLQLIDAEERLACVRSTSEARAFFERRFGKGFVFADDHERRALVAAFDGAGHERRVTRNAGLHVVDPDTWPRDAA